LKTVLPANNLDSIFDLAGPPILFPDEQMALDEAKAAYQLVK
jgi:hypothetical protein